jgi:hypothetical protein
LAAELMAAEQLFNTPAAASAAAAAAEAAALLERATGGGHYGPASHMYDGSRPSRFDFGNMWAGMIAHTISDTLYSRMLVVRSMSVAPAMTTCSLCDKCN